VFGGRRSIFHLTERSRHILMLGLRLRRHRFGRRPRHGLAMTAVGRRHACGKHPCRKRKQTSLRELSQGTGGDHGAIDAQRLVDCQS